jgi:hypothetical protein
MRRAYALTGVIVAFAACGSATGAIPSSGIAGRVVSGPTCPVETVPPRPECAPRPLAATLKVHRIGSHRPAIVVRSGADGRFRVRLRAGRYVVKALPESRSPLPRPPLPFDVRVKAGRFTRVRITYDSGIR